MNPSEQSASNAYDDFSQDYDRFVNWENRLAYEMPFLDGQLQVLGQPENIRLLDAACGTGMHALALARRGYRVSGADYSPGMIARARENAAAAGMDLPFLTAGFGELAGVFFPQRFDALLCLGNSLPHVIDRSDREAALGDFAACLRPGGLLLLQNRNFDAVMARRERWMEPQSYRQGEAEWVFLRQYDFTPQGLIDFHIITLKRREGETWRQQVVTTHLAPLLQTDLLASLAEVGFIQINCYGALDGSPFDPAASGNLVITAQKA